MEKAKTVNRIVLEYINTDLLIKSMEKEQAERKEKIVNRYGLDMASKDLTTKTHFLEVKYTTKADFDSLTKEDFANYEELQAQLESIKAQMKAIEKKASRKQTGYSLTVKENK